MTCRSEIFSMFWTKEIYWNTWRWPSFRHLTRIKMASPLILLLYNTKGAYRPTKTGPIRIEGHALLCCISCTMILLENLSCVPWLRTHGTNSKFVLVKHLKQGFITCSSNGYSTKWILFVPWLSIY